MSTINFWSDRWSRETTLQTSFLEVYDLTDGKNLKVKDCFASDEWNWSRILGDGTGITHGLSSNLVAFTDRVAGFKVE